jgi:hypothetical protein
MQIGTQRVASQLLPLMGALHRNAPCRRFMKADLANAGNWRNRPPLEVGLKCFTPIIIVVPTKRPRSRWPT